MFSSLSVLTFCLTFCLAIITSLFVFILVNKYIFKYNQLKSQFVSLMVVLGSGGHTSEMMALLKGLKIGSVNGKYSPISFVTANGDLLSQQKAKQFTESLTDCQFLSITRSRSVGQSYWTSIVTTIISLFESFYMIWKVRPQLIICNGPAICYPICLSAKLISKVMSTEVKIVFIESFCRTESLSLTGKLVYHSGLYDHFLVQWPQLSHQYTNTQFIGLLV